METSGFLHICLLFIASIHLSSCIKITDITDSFLKGSKNGTIACFVDFNQDKLIDVLVIGENGRSVDVLVANLESQYIRQSLINLTSDEYYITGLQSTDFDGDALNDLALIKRRNHDSDSSVKIEIYWGISQQPLVSSSNVSVEFRDDPMIIDWDGDLFPDLMGELTNGTRVLVKCSTYRNFTVSPFPSTIHSLPKLQVPQSSAFIDINHDLYADLVVTTEDGYELYYNEGGRLTYNRTEPFPSGTNKDNVKQITLVDIDMSSHMAMVVPVCNSTGSSSTTCRGSSSIWVYNFQSDKWTMMLDSSAISGLTWGFYDKQDGRNYYPVTLRSGDYNMDGYDDMVTIVEMQESAGSEDYVTRAMLFLNVECTHAYCNSIGRSFQADVDQLIWNLEGAVLSAFFDIEDNGVFDILIVAMTPAVSGSQSYPVIRAYKQTATNDACFIKIQVASGVCYNNCPNNAQPYGVNQFGATVKYQTTSVDGSNQQAIAGQLSQSAHFALQSPYARFGLGMTPNYVDNVYVGMPQSVENSEHNVETFRAWTQVIPNSQLMVIPYPLNDPSSWTMILFLTPSAFVYYVGAAFLGACLFVGIIAGILHWRERIMAWCRPGAKPLSEPMMREDAEEKRQESHKFHFDAM